MSDVFDAVRRGYTELETSSNEEIIAYFDSVDEESIAGHVSNIKGIYFEQVYVESLEEQGISASLFEETNHPVVDISIDDDELYGDFQLKATDSVSYINDTLETNPDVPVIATSEVAANFDSEMVIDSGISNEALESEVVSEVIGESINPIGIGSIIGLFCGLPF